MKSNRRNWLQKLAAAFGIGQAFRLRQTRAAAGAEPESGSSRDERLTRYSYSETGAASEPNPIARVARVARVASVDGPEGRLECAYDAQDRVVWMRSCPRTPLQDTAIPTE